MAHEYLKGISGLICFLNHPLRESKIADDGEHGIAYHRLLREAQEEYSRLTKAAKSSETQQITSQNMICNCTNSCVSAIYICKDCGGRVKK